MTSADSTVDEEREVLCKTDDLAAVQNKLR